ncbi:IS30 family transposase [Nakamurella sp. UYEF19]|uniref:IS30 family transposase n=1 Tax=Nakamurella sp. UYEF19 TaxID=1756392 RepID=UPI003390D099
MSFVRGVELTFVDREEISRGIEAGDSGRVIAARLGRDDTVVNREIKRHGGRQVYRAVAAQRSADRDRLRVKARRVESDPRVLAAVNLGLSQAWSPRQIAARLVLDHPQDQELRLSHEAIYQALYCQARGQLKVELVGALRRGGTKRVSRAERRAVLASKAPIKDMVMITDRPAEADDRAVPGHWEGDLIMGAGNASAVITLVERTTRFVILQRCPYDHTADRVAVLLSTAMGRLPQLLKRSLAWDQGREMAAHAKFTIATDIPVFFCDPHSPWQRGSNENTNGLLRQFMPKGTDLSVHSQLDLNNIAYLLNNRPRQTLEWLKPKEKLDMLLLESGEALAG